MTISGREWSEKKQHEQLQQRQQTPITIYNIQMRNKKQVDCNSVLSLLFIESEFFFFIFLLSILFSIPLASTSMNTLASVCALCRLLD